MNCVSIFRTGINEAKFTNLALVGTACFVCSKIPDELLRCQKCKRISYCSEACRQADFESHEKICLALHLAPDSTPAYFRYIMFGLEIIPYSPAYLPYNNEIGVHLLYEAEKSSFLNTIGPENFTAAHNDLLLYEPRCAVCLRSADDVRSALDPEYTSLLFCPRCRAAFACTDAHADAYLAEHCRELEDGERYTECEMNQRAYEHSLEIVTRGWTETETLWFPKRRKVEYSPLPTATDTWTVWDQWFADPSNLCPPDSSPILNRVRTFQLSIPMTVLYGMECFDEAAALAARDSSSSSPELLPLLVSSPRVELDIAVIGAMEYELRFGGLACWEEILHSLPSLRKLRLRFIGPQVGYGLIKPDNDHDQTSEETAFKLSGRIIRPEDLNSGAVEWELCALCKEKGVEIHASFHPALFHEYVEDPERCTLRFGRNALDGAIGIPFRWPDLAVMFNTGMGNGRARFNPGWSPTLEALAENGVPTLCTAFLHREAKDDEELLNFTRCNIVIGRHKNPWRSEVVMKTVFSEKAFFSYNQFIQGFRGMKERERDEAEGESDVDAHSESCPPFVGGKLDRVT